MIKIKHGDKEYTLAFNRKTIVAMENSGFIIKDVATKLMTSLPRLFNGAFQMHHRGMTEQITTEILESMESKDDLLAALVELYYEPINAMLENNETGEKKATWTKI